MARRPKKPFFLETRYTGDDERLLGWFGKWHRLTNSRGARAYETREKAEEAMNLFVRRPYQQREYRIADKREQTGPNSN